MPSFGEFLANGEVQKWNVTKAQLERSGGKVEVRRLEITETDLTGIDLDNVVVSHVDFVNCSFGAMDATASTMTQVRFKDCVISKLTAPEARWSGVLVSNSPPYCRVGPVNLISAVLDGCTFVDVDSVSVHRANVNACRFRCVDGLFMGSADVLNSSLERMYLGTVFADKAFVKNLELYECHGGNSTMVSGRAGSGNYCSIVKEVQAFRLVTGCLEWESIRNCLNYLDGHVWEWEDTDDDTRRKWRENFLLWLAYAANSIGVDIPKGENGD